MSENALRGLKAEALTTEVKPKLRLLFLPRFWGSFESRHEKGKTHLVPEILRGWDTGDRTLCGQRIGESEDEGEIAGGGALPPFVCKRCQSVARRRYAISGATQSLVRGKNKSYVLSAAQADGSGSGSGSGSGDGDGA